MSGSDEPRPLVDVGETARILWREKLLVGACILAGVLLGFVYSLIQPDEYTAFAEVLIRPLGIEARDVNRPDTIDPVAERELGESLLVATKAHGLLDVRGVDADMTPRELRRVVVVRTIDDSRVLEFSFVADERDVAQEGTQAFADAYLEIRAEQGATITESALEALDEQEADLTARIDALQAEDDTSSAELLTLLSEAADVRAERAQLRGLSRDPGEVISAAQLPEAASSTGTIPLTAVGGLLGLVAGIALALFRNQRSASLSARRRQLERLDIPTMATIPPPSTTASPMEVVVGGRPIAQTYRELAATLALATSARSQDVVLVTSPSTSPIGPQVASRLALAAAGSGTPVLVNASLTDHTIERGLDIESRPGLVECVLDGLPVTEAAQWISETTLDVVPPGREVEDEDEIYRSARFVEAFEHLRAEYSTVVVGGVATIEEAHLATIAVVADAALLVVDESNDRETIQLAVERLGNLGIEVVGSVLVDHHEEAERVT